MISQKAKYALRALVALVKAGPGVSLMISVRPYRPPLSVAGALAEIEDGAGTQFDPGVVRAFLRAWSDGELDRFLPRERLIA